MIKHYCDRCEAEMDPRTPLTIEFGMPEKRGKKLEGMFGAQYLSARRSYMLCKDCFVEVFEFVRHNPHGKSSFA